MRFYVTKADIRNGKAYDCVLCPVALSIKRRLPKLGIAVGVRYVRVNLFEDYPFLEAKVSNFINRFDSGLPVKPFSFSIPNLERIMQ